MQVYPRLTHLTIYYYCIFLIRQYIDAFPALRVLRFDYTLSPWGSATTPTHSLLEATRRGKTTEEIRRRNKEDQFVRGSWPGLKHFRAVTSDAYLAGLTCQVATLHLIAWGGTLEGEVSAICELFADAQPSVFRLSLRPAHVDYIAALFSERVGHFQSLPSLELRLDVTDLPFDLKSYLVRVHIPMFTPLTVLFSPPRHIFVLLGRTRSEWHSRVSLSSLCRSRSSVYRNLAPSQILSGGRRFRNVIARASQARIVTLSMRSRART